MASDGNGEPFYGSHWDPMVSQNEFGNANFLENQIMASSSHLVHFPPDSSLVEMLPKIPSFGSGNYSEMVTSFGHITQSASHHSSFAKHNVMGTQLASNSRHHEQKSEDGVSPNEKRKRKASVEVSPKNAEEEERQQDNTCEIPNDEDEKKRKLDQNIKQAKETSTCAEPSKENYIHVRAKRGQATNSHSLAERVRRERISERMRLLQELVPGCNKITGKAVMLDEIINYVQSLQQQVEFLSMKLATVNPEVNVDIECLLPKDILHSRGSNGISLGNGLALNSSHPFPGYPHAMFNTSQGATTPFHPLPQNIWNSNEIQSILQMGFDSDHPVSSLGPNGISKMEL